MKKVLVADDNFVQVNHLILDLKEQYDVDYVEDGKKALAKIKKIKYDALILDWQMAPKFVIDNRKQYYGDNVARIARQMYDDVIIILRSTSADQFKDEFSKLNIYCHTKGDDDTKILNLLSSKFNTLK